MQELVLELKNIEKSYHNKNVLSIDHLPVYQNEKIGIIGKNGQGKSTLLDIIYGKSSPDTGDVQKTIEFQYYEQVTAGPVNYEQIDGALLGKLQIPKHSFQHFSGGEQSRARLAQTFSYYTMGLLMDEPTTHVDSEGITFLIEELKYFYGTLLVVSHDRLFLDKVVDKIWEVNEGTVTVFNGNYTSYIEQKKQQRLEQEKAYEQFIKEKDRLEQAAKKKQEQARKINRVSQKQKNKQVSPGRLGSTKQKDTVQKGAHKAAKSIEKRVEQLDTIENIVREKEIEFPDSKTIEMHNPFPIMGEEVTIKKGNNKLLETVNFQFGLGKRIGIEGPNGSGKTSLLKHILNESEGITLSPKVIFTVYNQMDYKLKEEISMIDYLAQDSEYQESVIRAVLNNLGFSQMEVDKSLADLSGGEATRLIIAKLFTDPSNVLILDEPTNFIDIQTIQALENLMKAYKGTILFTSHDHYFIENLAEEIWEVKDKKLILKKYKMN